MTAVTIEILERALKETLAKKGMGDEQIRDIAQFMMNFFGDQDEFADSGLSPEDRDIFYMLEGEGILTAREDEAQRRAGVRQIHYWVLNKESISKSAARSSQPGKKKEEPSLYDKLSAKVSCIICGKLVDSGAEKCPNCGFDMKIKYSAEPQKREIKPLSKEELETGNKVKCPLCNKLNPASANSCDSCGSLLKGKLGPAVREIKPMTEEELMGAKEKIKCPVCSRTSAKGTEKCQNCGYAFVKKPQKEEEKKEGGKKWCPYCTGSGATLGGKCTFCSGTGFITESDKPRLTCVYCTGTGKTVGGKCVFCDGEGWVTKVVKKRICLFCSGAGMILGGTVCDYCKGAGSIVIEEEEEKKTKEKIKDEKSGKEKPKEEKR